MNSMETKVLCKLNLNKLNSLKKESIFISRGLIYNYDINILNNFK